MVQELAREVGRSIRRRPVDPASGDLTLPIAPTGITFLALDPTGALVAAAAVDAGAGIIAAGTVDNAIQRADGTSGTVVQGSDVVIDDDGNISGTVGYVDLGEISEPAIPAANRARLFAVDEGDTVTQVKMKDHDGTVSPLSHFIAAGTGAVTRRVRTKLREAVSVQDFGATGIADPLVNDTDAFANAMATSFNVYVPPGFYRVGDLVIPSGVTLYGASTKGNLSYTPGLTEIKKWSEATDCILDTNDEDGVTIQGMTIDGTDRSIIGIRAGGDNVTLRDMHVLVCSVGYGIASGSGIVPQTSQIENCHLVNNVYGIRGAVDCTVIGGAITSNQTHGVWLPPGSNHNTFLTRVEHNGSDAAGIDGEGWNYYLQSCSQNVIMGTIDSGYLGGIRMTNCSRSMIEALIQRSGVNNSGNSQEDCHVMLEDCTGIIVNIATRQEQSDAHTGPFTPKYSVWLHGNSTQNDSITLMGDLNGFATRAVRQTGNRTRNLNLLANGAKSPTKAFSVLPSRSSVTFSDFLDGVNGTPYTAAVSGTGAGRVYPDSVGCEPSRRRPSGDRHNDDRQSCCSIRCWCRYSSLWWRRSHLRRQAADPHAIDCFRRVHHSHGLHGCGRFRKR